MNKGEISLALVFIYLSMMAITNFTLLLIAPGLGFCHIFLANPNPVLITPYWDAIKNNSGWQLVYAWNWLLFIGLGIGLFIVNTKTGQKIWKKVF